MRCVNGIRLHLPVVCRLATSRVTVVSSRTTDATASGVTRLTLVNSHLPTVNLSEHVYLARRQSLATALRLAANVPIERARGDLAVGRLHERVVRRRGSYDKSEDTRTTPLFSSWTYSANPLRLRWASQLGEDEMMSTRCPQQRHTSIRERLQVVVNPDCRPFGDEPHTEHCEGPNPKLARFSTENPAASSNRVSSRYTSDPARPSRSQTFNRRATFATASLTGASTGIRRGSSRCVRRRGLSELSKKYRPGRSTLATSEMASAGE